MQRSPGFLLVPDPSLAAISYEPQNLPKIYLFKFYNNGIIAFGDNSHRP
jgi:hypothetical protein